MIQAGLRPSLRRVPLTSRTIIGHPAATRIRRQECRESFAEGDDDMNNFPPRPRQSFARNPVPISPEAPGAEFRSPYPLGYPGHYGVMAGDIAYCSSEISYRSRATDEITTSYPRPTSYAESWCPSDESQSGGTPVSYPRWAPQSTDTRRSGPLRIVHVGTQFVQAGIDQWLTGLIHHADPERLRFLRCIVTTDMVDYAMAADLRVPIVVGGRESVRQAALDCDVLLMAGPPALGEWLDDCPPRLGVFVAHGVCNWTRTFLEGCRPVIDHVVAVSPLVQQTMCDGIPSTVIFNGVDPRHLVQSRPREETRAECGFEPGDFVLGYVGRFSPEKRPEVLIEAVARLPRNFKLLLVGWGGMRGELLEMANRLIPGRFAFAESGPYLGDWYAAMDAFCLASEYEGFGLVILEAMLCRKPVIVSSVGFVPEAIVDRVNGLVIDGSATQIAAAARLLDGHPHWAQAIAAEGHRYAQQHGYASQMTVRYADLLETLWEQKFGK